MSLDLAQIWPFLIDQLMKVPCIQRLWKIGSWEEARQRISSVSTCRGLHSYHSTNIHVHEMELHLHVLRLFMRDGILYQVPRALSIVVKIGSDVELVTYECGVGIWKSVQVNATIPTIKMYSTSVMEGSTHSWSLHLHVNVLPKVGFLLSR